MILRICLFVLVGPLGAASACFAAAADSRGLAGNWSAEQTSSASAAPTQAILTFTDINGALRGVMRAGSEQLPLFDVKEAGTALSFTLVIPGAPYIAVHYSGTRTGDEIRLASPEEGNGVFMLTARRAEQPQTASLQPPPSPAAAPPVTTPPPASPPMIAGVPAAPYSLPAPAPARVQPSTPQSASVNPPPSPPAAVAAPAAKPVLPPLRDLPSNNLAKTPPMGWASRGKLGTMIDDEAIRLAAEGLDETGLRAAGFVTVEVDDGWQGTRDGTGALHGNDKFPDLKALGDYIHSKGLKFGLQTSIAPKSCGGFEGSYGHEEQDARTFASWGVDYLIYDGCGAETIYTTQQEQQAAYQKMAEALRATGRDIVLSISQNGAFAVAQWGAKAGANLWRTGRDIEDNWKSMTEAGFGENGKEALAGPSHWNDPGLLQAGNGGMTADEYRSQLNLWAVLAAPMILGNEVRIMTRDTLVLLTNAEVIAIDQDPLGRPGKRVAQNGETEVWARPLADGSTAVAFFNRGDRSAPIAVSWEQLGINGPRRARDLWWHENLGTANGRYVVFLTPHTSLLLRLSR